MPEVFGRWWQRLVFFVILLAPSIALAHGDGQHYGEHPAAKAFVEKMVSEHGFERDYVAGLMAQAERKQSILDAISRPAEKTLTWAKYRKIFITSRRIRQGQEFIEQHGETLRRAEQDFGVPVEIIAAIIGVETSYGRNKGSYRVLDSLATLGFDYPRRSKFFSGQLEQYLLLVKEQQFDPLAVKGSYAGAMGYGQFIPSSYRHYAIDYDGDGVADIVNNPVDAIGSVANYFKSHGWRPGEPVTVKASVTKPHNKALANQALKPEKTVAEFARQGYRPAENIATDQPATAMRLQGSRGEEHWLGLYNFYVISRYNHSRLYSMAVYQLSQALAAG